jgi:6-pyruvoyltetrahydropterin/6-carboxytetrahydropterin synthase
MGHRVTNHASKCRNLHGHRYVALVHLESRLINTPGASDEGMVMDFASVKDAIGRWIDEQWDHGFMIYKKDPLAKMLLATDTKVIAVDYIPTAENLAQALLEKARQLVGAVPNAPQVTSVTIYETPNCSAEASAWQ